MDRSVFGSLVFLAAGIGVASCASSEPEDRATLEIDVLEAVYRHQFMYNASSATALGKVDVYFLEFEDGQDPPSKLMSRFAAHSPLVAPISAEDETKRKVTHKQTGGRGIILRIESVRWIGGGKVEVKGGYWEAGLSASGNTYTLKFRNGKWVVVGDAMKWIS